MSFCFEPYQIFQANGRWYSVASVKLGAVGQCNMVGLHSLSERNYCAINGEMFVPEDILLELVARGVKLYQPVEVAKEEKASGRKNS